MFSINVRFECFSISECLEAFFIFYSLEIGRRNARSQRRKSLYCFKWWRIETSFFWIRSTLLQLTVGFDFLFSPILSRNDLREIESKLKQRTLLTFVSISGKRKKQAEERETILPAPQSHVYFKWEANFPF